VDRIVLNAFFPLGHNPGGLRVWWRRWHDDSDAELDNTHLMRLAGRACASGSTSTSSTAAGSINRTDMGTRVVRERRQSRVAHYLS
jgi:hypothetical protein